VPQETGRVCLLKSCGLPISSIRNKRSKYCSTGCTQRANYEAKKTKLDGVRIVRKLVVHVCVEPLMDEAPTGNCSCLKQLTVEKVEHEVAIGNVVWMNDGAGNAHAVLYAKRRMVPKAATIERTHIERGFAHLGASIDKYRKFLPNLETMIKNDDKNITIDVEEQFRMDEYQRLSVASLASLIREVPAEEFDRMEREQRDVPVVSGLEVKDRTEGGIGKSVASRGPREDEEPEEMEEEPAETIIGSTKKPGKSNELANLIAEQHNDLVSDDYAETEETEEEDEEVFELAAD
jgi:hypothetical protein